MRLVVFGFLLACSNRPPVGDRTILIEIPIRGVTHSMHRDVSNCEECLREQRPGETLVSCAQTGDEHVDKLLYVGEDHHFETMMCSFEAP